MLSRQVPISRWIGRLATLPAMSHKAMSTAPIARMLATRARAHSSRLSRSRSSGFCPMTMGLRKWMRPGPSRLAGLEEVPRNA